jgi:hypothetical protein
MFVYFKVGGLKRFALLFIKGASEEVYLLEYNAV